MLNKILGWFGYQINKSSDVTEAPHDLFSAFAFEMESSLLEATESEDVEEALRNTKYTDHFDVLLNLQNLVSLLVEALYADKPASPEDIRFVTGSIGCAAMLAAAKWGDLLPREGAPWTYTTTPDEELREVVAELVEGK